MLVLFIKSVCVDTAMA